MKKLSTFIGGTGIIILFISASCNFEDHPILMIPIVIGTFLIYLGYYIEKRWTFDDNAEYDFDLIDFGDDGTDDDITYITYDGNGREQYMGIDKNTKEQSASEYLSEMGVDIQEPIEKRSCHRPKLQNLKQSK